MAFDSFSPQLHDNSITMFYQISMITVLKQRENWICEQIASQATTCDPILNRSFSGYRIMEETRLEGTSKNNLVQPDGWLCSEVVKNRKRETIWLNEIGPVFISVCSHQEHSGFHLAKDNTCWEKSTLNPLKGSFEFKWVIYFYYYYYWSNWSSYSSNFPVKYENAAHI